MTDNDIDMVIRKLDEKYKNEQDSNSENSQQEQKLIQSSSNNKNLLDEASNIAEVRKYHLMIQNVGLSNNMSKFFINQHRKNNK